MRLWGVVMGTGRPSSYTKEIGDRICEEIAGGKSLREICKAKDVPSANSVYRWLEKDELFRKQYARAREQQAETIFDEMLDIADEASNDWMVRNDGGNEAYQVNGEAIQRSRLRIDARKWVLGKLKPKKYADKVIHSGDEDAPLQIQQIERVIVDPHTKD